MEISFIIKECLKEVVNNKLDLGNKRKQEISKMLNLYDDNQLLYILSSTSQGLKADDIYIYFYNNIGFRCINDTSKTGKLPICNIIQKILNKKYNDLISNV